MGQNQSIAVIITVGSAEFVAQADRLHAIGWALLALHLGLDPALLRIQFPVVPDITIDHPRAHVLGPDLQLPPLPPGCVVFRPEWARNRLERAFEQFQEDPRVTLIIWIYLNHGSRAGLYFPAKGGATQCFEAAPVVTMLRGFDDPKPVIAIIDSCYSTCLAKTVVEAVDKDSVVTPVCFLTSGDDVCYCSAYVISDDPQLGLPTMKGTVQQDGESIEVEVGIRQGHSMFTRALMVPVVYGGDDLSLSDLAAILNGVSSSDQGFKASYSQTLSVIAVPRLRDFVPAPFRAADLIAGTGYFFSDVFRPEPVNLLYDDMGNFLNAVSARKSDKMTGYVVISSDRHDLADPKLGSRCVIGTGYFYQHPAHGVANWVAQLGAIKDRNTEPRENTSAVYVPVQAIHMDLRARSFIRKSGIKYHESAFHSLEEWDRANNAIHVLQTTKPSDVPQITAIACYVSHLSDDAMVVHLKAARKRAAKQLGIALEDEAEAEGEGVEEHDRTEEEQGEEEEEEGNEEEEAEEGNDQVEGAEDELG
jgi:hypothetical protein